MTSIGIAVAVGLGVAVPVTLSDWRANPTGVFHDADGTHWRAVAETALSWFWPLAVAAFVTALAVNIIVVRFRARP
jgi:hypothetical protein